MLDAIELEQRGIPAIPVGVEVLIKSTGQAMARSQGYPEYAMVSFPHFSGHLGTMQDEAQLRAVAEQVAAQIEAKLIRS